MQRSKTHFAIVGLILGLMGTFLACAPKKKAEDACHFVQNSTNQRVSWAPQVPITLYVDSSVPTAAIPAIERAMEDWNRSYAPEGHALFHLGGIVDTGGRPKKDGANVIYWMEEWDKSMVSKEQARTTIYWFDENIFEADMALNANTPISWQTSPVHGYVDLESLVVHELGHVLGLAHNTTDTQTVMAKELSSGTERREPQKADLSSLSCEY